VLLSSISFIIALLAFEIVLRLSGYTDSSKDVALTIPFADDNSPDELYILLEDSVLLYGHNPAAQRYRINSFGARDMEYAREKQDARRIIMIGDSVLFGPEVDDGERFSEIIEKELENTEVINLGVGGYDIEQEKRMFEKALELDPDMIILDLYINDDAAKYQDKEDKTKIFEHFECHDYVIYSPFLLEHSHMYTGLRTKGSLRCLVSMQDATIHSPGSSGMSKRWMVLQRKKG
jgi:hypothetical protein